MATRVRSLNIGARHAQRRGPARLGAGPTGTGLTIAGDEELFKLLGLLPDRLARNILRGAPNAAAKEVRDEIRVKARSVLPQSKTLPRAIKNRRASSKGDDFRAHVFIEHGHGAKFDAFWWHFFEFGTVKHSARPFVRPGIDAGRGKVNSAMAGFIRKRFDKAVAK